MEEEEGGHARLLREPDLAAAADDDDEGVIACTARRRSCPYVPPELIESILRRSSLWASTRLQLVSRTWAAAGRNAVASHINTPWIFLRGHDNVNGSIGYLVSICGDGAFFRMKLPRRGCSLIGSRDGWLAFMCYIIPYPVLVNPFTGSQIRLPSLPRRRGQYYSAPSSFKCLASSSSSSSSAPAAGVNGLCIMASFGDDNVSTLHPGDEKWKWWNVRGWDSCMGAFRSRVVLSRGAFYVLDRRTGSVYVVDFPSEALTPLGAPGFPPPPSNSSDLMELVDSEGELLLLLVCCTPAALKGVYRLDLPKKKWVGLQSLGSQRALFVSSPTWLGCPFSVSVGPAAMGCRGDCVYLLERGIGPSWTVFDMADRAPKTVSASWPRSLLPMEIRTHREAWVLPNLGGNLHMG